MENLTVPVIKTDASGKVTYKNRAAIHCIPSPRKNASITDHIDKRLPPFKFGNKGAYVQQLKNGKSIFNRAMVLPDEKDGKIWIFTFQLQLMEPEDFLLVSNIAADTLYTNILNLAEEYRNSKDQKYFKRYQRWSAEVLSAMRCLTYEREKDRFRITDTLTSLSKKTAELSAQLNFRVCFNDGFCMPASKLKFYFIPFATIYAQLLCLTLRLSSDRYCKLDCIVIYDKLHLTVSTDTAVTASVQGGKLEELSSLFDYEFLNILMLDGLIGYYEYDIEFSIENSKLSIHLTVPLAMKNPTVLACPLPALIENMLFNRADTRALMYLESVMKA